MSRASAPVDLDAKRVERVREFQTAAADIRMIRHAERDLGIVCDVDARLGCRLPVHLDLSRQNQRASPLARRHQATGH